MIDYHQDDLTEVIEHYRDFYPVTDDVAEKLLYEDMVIFDDLNQIYHDLYKLLDIRNVAN